MLPVLTWNFFLNATAGSVRLGARLFNRLRFHTIKIVTNTSGMSIVWHAYLLHACILDTIILNVTSVKLVYFVLHMFCNKIEAFCFLCYIFLYIFLYCRHNFLFYFFPSLKLSEIRNSRNEQSNEVLYKNCVTHSQVAVEKRLQKLNQTKTQL